MFKERAKSDGKRLFFKHNYCHPCHITFAVLFYCPAARNFTVISIDVLPLPCETLNIDVDQ